MDNILHNLVQALEDPTSVDLDRLRHELTTAADALAAIETKLRLYETELQRELRAKVDLCGPVSGCSSPEAAFTLSGETLLAARHEAARRFNDVFCMAPIARRKC